MSDIKKRGLGRGLSALFGDAKSENFNEKNIVDQKIASISDITRNQFQPRINFDKDKLKELADSIKQNGIIQPIAVREDKLNKNKYEIIAGERRWLAAQQAGLNEVPIVVLNVTDNVALEIAVIENIQRENLNPVEEARSYERLNKEFRYDQDKIAKLMSKSRSHISNTMRLLSLPPDVISMLDTGHITAGQARPLIGLSNASSIAEEIMSKKMSARTVESMIKGKKNKSSFSVDVNIINIQKKIEDILGLRVLITNRKNNSGKITIEYKNLSQFELISDLLKKR
ncbi:ParB/RepB/Spo0J family partition protein [Pelagibacteraceae bacterium]|nr:ParB/RepB/Spo0J family partition protein [Pelagibacteraceae bacterium]